MNIVAFAYSCEPDKGSEPGAGWALVQMLASLGETWVITRTNNRPAIEKGRREARALENVHFCYVDLPAWARFWKKGPRGMRLYYLLWQVAALRKARQLKREVAFDCIWHLTIANAWIGTMASLAGLPFVYGPVGGGVQPPPRLLRTLGMRGLLYEGARQLVRSSARYLNPLSRISWRRASLILVQNPETARWFPSRYRDRTRIFQHAVITRSSLPSVRPAKSSGTALFAARLLPWKGGYLAIKAVALAERWRLIVCGTGPDESRLRKLAGQLQPGRVEFRGRVSQEELFHLMAAEADVLLFPSLHDDAPLAVAEAVVAGLPVVCLDVGGPPLIAGPAGKAVTAKGSARQVVKSLAASLEAASPDAEALQEAGTRLLMQNRIQELRRVVEGVITR